MTCLLGLGTYRCADVGAAAEMAVGAECSLIDTAPVYDHGRAQPHLAPVLTHHPQVRVSTKIGHMTASQAQQAVRDGVLGWDEADRRHSIAGAYIDYQLHRNTIELNRHQLDLIYLHNPDQHTTDQRTLHAEIRHAFARLEAAWLAGRIAGYGVATWAGFTSGAFTVADLTRLARQAAGSPTNGLAAVQMPVSLVEITPLQQAANGHGPIVEAVNAGLEAWASAPLHGGELATMVRPKLAHFIAPGTSPVTAAVMTVAAAPVTGLLASTSTRQHWDEIAAAVRQPALPPDHLKEICDLLLHGP